MKTIEVDDELYQYIASNTKFIGESASDILRRLLAVDQDAPEETVEAVEKQQENIEPVATTTINSDAGEVEQPIIDESPEETEVVAEEDSNDDDFIADSFISGQKIFDVINKEELATQRGAVGRFLLILSNLHRVHSDKFNSVLEIRGRNRVYFSKDENELLESGSSTKPKQIPDSKYWVLTNSNTTKKKKMLTDVAKKLGYTAEETEIIRDFL